MKTQIRLSIISISFLIFTALLNAQNPIIRDQFSADPTARVFNGRVYVYPSHDIVAKPGQGRPNWFCMADYHVFSSDNLTDWKDHGVIVSQNKVEWVDSTAYSMWAPDCIERNGKYYFYFPSNANSTVQSRGFRIGVAIADKPEGPFIPQAKPIEGVRGIDPNVFIDDDGQAYLYWSQGNIFGAKLKENMIDLASEVSTLKEFPTAGLKEGPFLFKRNGKYYMTYPHVENRIERLEYAIGDNPLGPFKFAGVVMDESPMNCWTNHHSFIELKGQWYLFYHQNAYSPKFDKNRSVCIDSMFFNNDGTIRKVIPTHRGVGLTLANSKIEIDRYSNLSEKGVNVELIDTLNTFKGWKSVFVNKGAWLGYNAVDFGKKSYKKVSVMSKAKNGATLKVKLNGPQGSVISELKIPASEGWIISDAKISKKCKGVNNLYVVLEDDNSVEVDYISFK